MSRLRRFVVAALELGEAHYEQLAQLYKKVYPEDVPILPPDRYGDLVVQPVTGCPNRACTFCAFYRDKPYQLMAPDLFEQHLSGIELLLGGRVSKDGLFIGSANPMALSQRRLVGYLEQINRRFGTFKRGIAAFSDPDFSARRTAEQWQALSDLGVVRLVIGLETGWGALRERLGKSADLTKVHQAVNDYKRAGISVGLTVLTGACRQNEQEENVQRTGTFIRELALDKKDIIYLSPLDASDIDRESGLYEMSVMKEHFSHLSQAKIVPYQMQRFHYYC